MSSSGRKYEDIVNQEKHYLDGFARERASRGGSEERKRSP